MLMNFGRNFNHMEKNVKICWISAENVVVFSLRFPELLVASARKKKRVNFVNKSVIPVNIQINYYMQIIQNFD